MQLCAIPTNALLAEIARRCEVAGPLDHADEIPAWAFSVLSIVADEFGLTPSSLLVVSNRSAAAARARHLAMALLRETRPERSFRDIAGLFGQDFGTAIHACRSVVARRATEPASAAQWERCITALDAGALRRSARQGARRDKREPAA